MATDITDPFFLEDDFFTNGSIYTFAEFGGDFADVNNKKLDQKVQLLLFAFSTSENLPPNY